MARNERGNGLLLHITSLPSPFGIGDLGPDAFQFADFLKSHNQKYWQILPLNPTGTYLGNSPYTSYSVFATNALLISPALLEREGLLDREDLQNIPDFPEDHVDYRAVTDFKAKLLRKSYDNFKSRRLLIDAFELFVRENAGWLDDYAFFAAFRSEFNESPWHEWPEPIRDRDPKTLSEWSRKLENRINMSKFFQFMFFRQWFALKHYCNQENIKIIGDMPIYPSIDSSDAWSHPDIFKLDANKEPLFVAGAPPDYFSETGQRWGNPVYRWDYLKQTGYDWWMRRIEHNLKMFDTVRVDHFRGFVGYWEIPSEEETAVNGKWVEAPAKDFFTRVIQRFPVLPLIAEDLGLITDDVRDVMREFGFPGMKVLLFAFGDDLPTNPYAPHNYDRNSVVYTGTHDNNTVRGWIENEADNATRNRFYEYVGRQHVGDDEAHWEMVRLAMSSVSDIAILPFQDLLGLGQDARMNHPSRARGNWSWRLVLDLVTGDIRHQLGHMTYLYGRS